MEDNITTRKEDHKIRRHIENLTEGKNKRRWHMFINDITLEASHLLVK